MRACVLGSGSWGTALAALLVHAGVPTWLWARDPETARELARARCNARYLPELAFPDDLWPTTDLSVAMEADLVVVAVPSQAMRGVARQLRVRRGTPVVSATKGFELGSTRRMTEVLAEELPEAVPLALSGPNLAGEIALGRPASTVIGGELAASRLVQQAFNSERFRVYTNEDLVGVELGGALKNITALAAGILDGLGLGDNAKAALMTRGLAENARLGVAMGAEAATFSGLAGMGDLVATCASPLSRNHRVGVELSRGFSLQDLQDRLHLTAEGVHTTVSALELARRHHVELPIASQIYAVLYEGLAADQAVSALMGRPPRSE
ncbi:MAG TPA: NAD(P)H-dependent glycerol-3-phosphate dehydrogenase [Stenomitos sp.]